MSRPKDPERLDSWKAIARYLGRSVRTVRRWEQQEGLPVHRLMHRAQASVYAYPRELEAWREDRARGPAEQRGESLPERRADSDAGGRSKPDDVAGPGAAIAVLPFSFAGPDPGQAWVADGLAEEMINGFSRLDDLRVTSRTSSAASTGGERDSAAIARMLGVNYLLEGGVVGDGRRLRISVRLIDPERDDHLWSRRFAGDMEDIFDIQERIARSVVAALKLRLAPAEEHKLSQRSVDDVRAWRRVLLARQTALRWRADALDTARTLLEEALELMGENATICATMGRVLVNYREAGITPGDDALEEARAWAARARAADADHPETLICSAWLAYAEGDLARAIAELEQALESDRDHPDALTLLANCLILTGQLARARPVIDHALAVDPLTPLTRCLSGYADSMEGRFEAAIGPYHSMLERDPANPVARLFNVWILFMAGRSEEAMAVADGFGPEAAGSMPARVAGSLVSAHLGRIEELPLPMEPGAGAVGSEFSARITAEAWAMTGHAEPTAAWLALAVERGFANWPYLSRHSPFFAPLADDPALQPVLARVKQRWEALIAAA